MSTESENALLLPLEEECVTVTVVGKCRKHCVWKQYQLVIDMLNENQIEEYEWVKDENGIVDPNTVVGIRKLFWVIPKPDYIHVFHDGTSSLCKWKTNKTVKQMLEDNFLFRENASVEDGNAIINPDSMVGARRYFWIIPNNVKEKSC